MTVFFVNADGSVGCAHRDMCVCPECATAPGCREIYGRHYFMTDAEWASFQASVEDWGGECS